MKNQNAVINAGMLSFKSFIQALKADLQRLNAGGQIFTVVFVTKQGKERVMNCRLSVTKHLKGGKSTIDHCDNLLGVFDMQKRAYRCINLETVKRITTNGKTVEFK